MPGVDDRSDAGAPYRPADAASPPFRIGPWRVEPGLNRLDGPTGEVAVEPRVMEVLVCLARHAGETVSKEQLLAEVWHGAFVVEGVIPKAIFALRQALGDDAAAPRYVLTVARRGYRLLVPVEDVEPGESVQPRRPDGPDGPDGVGGGPAAGAAAGAEGTPPVTRPLRTALLVAVALLAVAAVGWLRRSQRAIPPQPRAAITELAVARFGAAGGVDAELLAGALWAETVGELVRCERPAVQLLPAGSDPLAQARAEGADALLLGTVDASGPTVRVELQLLDTASAQLAWTGSFEREPGELLELRRLLAAAVAERVGARLDDGGAGASTELLSEATYRRFLEARHLWMRRGGDLARAHELFAAVTREAPEFGEGFAWLALSHVTRANYLASEPVAELAAAEAAARRAVELAPADPVAHTAAGLVAINRRAAATEAIDAYRKAIALAPSFALPRQFLAETYMARGRFDDALTTLDGALALEPLSPMLQAVRGLILMAAGRSEEAIAQFDRALVLEPRFTWLYRYRGYALIRLGRESEAIDALLGAPRRAQQRPEWLDGHEAAVAAEGLIGYWRRHAEGLESYVGSGGAGARPSQLAEAYAAIGRDAEAIALLDTAIERGDGEYFLVLRWSPAFDHLRGTPEFERVYARRGL